MSKTILGISAFYHDSAAALVRDGEIIAAAQEERFSRKKHDPRFPQSRHQLLPRRSLHRAGRSRRDRVLRQPPAHLRPHRQELPRVRRRPARTQFCQGRAVSMLGVKMCVAELRPQDARHARQGRRAAARRAPPLPRRLAPSTRRRSRRPRSSRSTASANGPPPPSASGAATSIELLDEIHYPHSLGLLYSAFTYFCGFKVNSGEYKLMGLAPYGAPRYRRPHPAST